MTSQAVKAATQQLGRDQIVETSNHHGNVETLTADKTAFKNGHWISSPG